MPKNYYYDYYILRTLLTMHMHMFSRIFQDANLYDYIYIASVNV